MKFSSSAAFAAWFTSVLAAVALTNSDYSGIAEGKPFKITWSGAEGPVKIVVATGDSKDLKVVTTVTSGATGNSFTWTPDKGSLPSGTYAFEISDSTSTNYSPQFTYTGTGTASASVSSASVTSTGSSSTITSTSATITTSFSNSTTTTATKTSTDKSSSTGSATTTGSTIKPTINNNDGQRAQSSLAFVLVTVAGLLYFS